MAQPNIKVLNRWVSRFIPFILICTVGYATYVMVALLAVNYLLHNKRHGAAIPILVIYFILFLLMSLTYARLLYIVARDPGYVPLGPRALSKKGRASDPHRTSSRATDASFSSTNYESTPEPSNPDCPGLENFYTRDVFACESDGRPRWCTECQNWKPERSHHCREVGRCVRKMDHFCPWVGGVVGENAFKFFIQFVAYTALYCIFIIIVLAIYIHEVRSSKDHHSPNAQWWVILGIACFFGLFTFSMAVNTVRFALTNLSSIEVLGHKTQVKRFAIFVPRPASGSGDVRPASYTQVVYPVPVLPKAGGSNRSTNNVSHTAISPQDERDAKAVRVFAVVSTETGENPYDLGVKENWKDVMGERVIDWFLPIRRSPCCRHEHDESEYKLGDALKRARERNGIPINPEGPEGPSKKHPEMSQLAVPSSGRAAPVSPEIRTA